MHISRRKELEALKIVAIVSAVALIALLIVILIETGPSQSENMASSPYLIKPVEEADHLVGEKKFVSMNVEALHSSIEGASSPGGFEVTIHKAGGLSESDLELGTLGQFVYPIIPYERVDTETLVVYCDGLLPSSQDHGNIYLSGRLLSSGVYTFSFSVIDGAHNIVSNIVNSEVSA